MRLYLEIWGRLKNGKCLIDVAEFGVEEEELTRTVIWKGLFYRKKGETLMDFARRFFETEMKEKYEEAEAVQACEAIPGSSHCAVWLKELKRSVQLIIID